MLRKVLGLIMMLGAVVMVAWSVDHIDKASDAKIRAQSRQEAIGRPMFYKDVPIGHYRVVAVVETHFSTAVIERDDLDYQTTTPEKADLLVTDMMPSMMKVGYTFAVGGTSEKQ